MRICREICEYAGSICEYAEIYANMRKLSKQVHITTAKLLRTSRAEKTKRPCHPPQQNNNPARARDWK